MSIHRIVANRIAGNGRFAALALRVVVVALLIVASKALIPVHGHAGQTCTTCPAPSSPCTGLSPAP